jgi:hypothetical protein
LKKINVAAAASIDARFHFVLAPLAAVFLWEPEHKCAYL